MRIDRLKLRLQLTVSICLSVCLSVYLSIYLSIYLSKKSRLLRRKCKSTTRAPNNVMIKRPGEIKTF